jgi:hypothetical protein
MLTRKSASNDLEFTEWYWFNCRYYFTKN